MAIKVIVEPKAKPGGRAALNEWLETLLADKGPSQGGFLGSARYEVLDDPDALVEIAEWESAEARRTHMQASASTGVYAPLADMLAARFRATAIRELSGASADAEREPSSPPRRQL